MRRFIILAASLVLTGCNPPQKPSEERKTPAPSIGRFTVVFSPHGARDTLLIDTATGQTWRMVKESEKIEDGVLWERLRNSDPPTLP